VTGLSTTRRSVLLSALTLPTLCWGAESSDVTIVTATPISINALDTLNAYSGGHLAANGLKATVLGASSGPPAVQQLVGGRCQFIRTHPIDVIKAIAVHGVKIVSIANLTHGSNFVVLSAKKAPILSAEDLRGKRIGIAAAAGTTENYLDFILKKAGINPDQVSRYVAPLNPGSFTLIEQGRIDGCVTNHDIALALQRSGKEIEFWSTSRYVSVPGRCFFTTQDIIEKQPGVVLSFIRALKTSVEEIIAGPIEPLIIRAGQDFDLAGLRDPPHLARLIEDETKLWLEGGRENLLRNMPDLWAAACREFAAAGFAQIEDPTSLYTNSFLDQALKP
jgi:NitT/TauT family transport system substrate-binding protein